MGLRLQIGVNEADYEVCPGGHGLHHALLIQRVERVESGAGLGVPKAQLTARVQAVGEELAILVSHDAKVVAHRDVFDEGGPGRCYFQRCKVDTFDALAPAEESSIAVDRGRVATRAHVQDVDKLGDLAELVL